MAQVKGSAVIASIRFVREQYGEEAVDRILAALPEDDREAIGINPLVSAWYPMPTFLRFMQEAEKQLGEQDPELVRNMGRASADYGITTVYKIFFKVGSPEFIIGKATRVFGSYYDTGDVVLVESGPGHAVFDIKDFEGAPQFCARIRGWMERTVELAGAKNLRSAHSLCVHRGDAVCRFGGTWD